MNLILEYKCDGCGAISSRVMTPQNYRDLGGVKPDGWFELTIDGQGPPYVSRINIYACNRRCIIPSMGNVLEHDGRFSSR